MAKVHYSHSGNGPGRCGAGNGRKISRHITVTQDWNKVTCSTCLKGRESADGFEKFQAELMSRLGLSAATTRYEVATHGYGRKLIRGSGPCAGLLEWPAHTWTRITPRPLGLARATELANAQPMHAVVCVWMSAEKVYDNGKRPVVPDGWWPADAQSVYDAKGSAQTTQAGAEELVFRIASAPCGASDAFMHPACAHGLSGVAFHDMTIGDLLNQEIVYCDSCGERILPQGVHHV